MESAGVRRKRTLSGGAPRIAPRPPRRSDNGERAGSGSAGPVPQRGAPLPRPERGEQPLGAAEPRGAAKPEARPPPGARPGPCPKARVPTAPPPAALRDWETARGERSLRRSYAPQPQGGSLGPHGSPAPGRTGDLPPPARRSGGPRGGPPQGCVRPPTAAAPGRGHRATPAVRSRPAGTEPAPERGSAGAGQRRARAHPRRRAGIPGAERARDSPSIFPPRSASPRAPAHRQDTVSSTLVPGTPPAAASSAPGAAIPARAPPPLRAASSRTAEAGAPGGGHGHGHGGPGGGGTAPGTGGCSDPGSGTRGWGDAVQLAFRRGGGPCPAGRSMPTPVPSGLPPGGALGPGALLFRCRRSRSVGRAIYSGRLPRRSRSRLLRAAAPRLFPARPPPAAQAPRGSGVGTRRSLLRGRLGTPAAPRPRAG